jgi:hypothetical protein
MKMGDVASSSGADFDLDFDLEWVRQGETVYARACPEEAAAHTER